MFEGNFPGDLTEGFLRHEYLEGLIFGILRYALVTTLIRSRRLYVGKVPFLRFYEPIRVEIYKNAKEKTQTNNNNKNEVNIQRS